MKFNMVFDGIFMAVLAVFTLSAKGSSVDAGVVKDNANSPKYHFLDNKVSIERHGVLIPERAIAGWKAHFNGDLLPLAGHDGVYLALIRMTRDSYEKVYTQTGDRGYELRGDYISDWGLFKINLVDFSYQFIDLFLVSPVKLEAQIQLIQEKMLTLAGNSSSYQNAQKALQALLHAQKQGRQYPVPADIVLEDPRFMKLYGRLFAVGTAVKVAGLLGDPAHRQPVEYRMIAFELKLDAKTYQLHTTEARYFGPRENKDSGFYEIELDNDIYAWIEKIYKNLGWMMPASLEMAKPVMAYMRLGGQMQIFPVANIEDLFQLSDECFQILKSNSLYKVLLQADRKHYQSVGWNNQPMRLPKIFGSLRLVMFHATEAASFDVKYPERAVKKYVTFAALIDNSGNLKGIAPQPIQSPEESYECQGDVNYVLFNSGNVITSLPGAAHNFKLFLFNGAADSVIALASVNLQDLIVYLQTSLGELNKYQIDPATIREFGKSSF